MSRGVSFYHKSNGGSLRCGEEPGKDFHGMGGCITAAMEWLVLHQSSSVGQALHVMGHTLVLG